MRLRFGGTTPVYRVEQTTLAGIKAGMAVAVEVAAVDGHNVAADVVASGMQGVTPHLSAPGAGTNGHGN